MKKQETRAIPAQFNYLGIKSLSNEAREKLHLVKPQTLGQAMRVSGVTPADISVLSVFLSSTQ
jgi:tRNA uridine 5-carboxymethylaminomethyl modification enzyme